MRGVTVRLAEPVTEARLAQVPAIEAAARRVKGLGDVLLLPPYPYVPNPEQEAAERAAFERLGLDLARWDWPPARSFERWRYEKQRKAREGRGNAPRRRRR